MRVGASTVGRELGTAVMYDAYTLHTVSPIETGVRHSLVCATQIVFLPDYLSCNFIENSIFRQVMWLRGTDATFSRRAADAHAKVLQQHAAGARQTWLAGVTPLF